MARSSECTEQYAQKVFDTADIVREVIFRQPQANNSEFWLEYHEYTCDMRVSLSLLKDS
jgi:hypothetical protein